MKTAIVHDWFLGSFGGEKVVQNIYEIFPSPIFSLIKDEKALKGSFFEKREINTSFIQKLPFARYLYRSYLPFFPLAIEQFDLSRYDLVISSSHCVAKGVVTNSEQFHICYCHTPMRYAWDLYFQYLQNMNSLKKKLALFFLHYLRMWDYSSSYRVDRFIANSKYVARRIKRSYGREADVIYPPVDIDFFNLYLKKENFYLTAGRMVPYKRIDLIVEAFSYMRDKKLVVIGDGPELKNIKSRASQNVEILGYLEDNILREYMQKAKAFIFAAHEDFGVLPIEAQACGTPVVVFAKGGCQETVVSQRSGLFFYEQKVNDIIKAIEEFEGKQDIFDPIVVRSCVEKFSSKRFKEEFKSFVEKNLNF